MDRNLYYYGGDEYHCLHFKKRGYECIPNEALQNQRFYWLGTTSRSNTRDANLMSLQGCQLHMNPIVKSLLEFNEAFEIPKRDEPGVGSQELIELRIKLLEEEVQEYAEAARAGDLVEILDALADIGYILAGTIINHGMQDVFDASFDEVHRSNMAKLVDGRVLRREDGKVLKPEGWTPPNLGQFLKQ